MSQRAAIDHSRLAAHAKTYTVWPSMGSPLRCLSRLRRLCRTGVPGAVDVWRTVRCAVEPIVVLFANNEWPQIHNSVKIISSAF